MSNLQPPAVTNFGGVVNDPRVLASPPPATKQEYLERKFTEWREQQKRRDDDPHVRAMVLALKGHGKTTFLATCRKPVLIHSFDPNGTTAIRRQIREGGIYVDDRFEYEDLRKPTAFDLWKAEFENLEANNGFAGLGTYCIDSWYLWMESLLAKQRLKFVGVPLDELTNPANIKGKDMRNLYGDFLEANLYWSRKLLNIPCNVVVTCHLDRYTDPISGAQETTLLAPGQASKERVPIPFSEVWVKCIDTGKPEADPMRHYVLTGNEGLYRGSTRIGANGLLKLREPANMINMLKACGYPTEPRSVS